MNITANAASLDWRSNKHGVWKALVKDMTPNSSVTFSDGLTGTVAGRQVTVESQSMPTGFMTYTTDDNTAVFGGVLYGVGTVSDSLEAVSGGKIVRMGSYTFTGNETWERGQLGLNNRYCFRCTSTISNIKLVNWGTVANVMCAGYIPGAPYHFLLASSSESYVGLQNTYPIFTNDAYLDAAAFAAYMAGKTIYYELATPVTSTETVQSLALQTGVNNLALNERDSSFTLDYTGTDFTLQLDSTHKYAFSDNGVKSVLTGSTEQAVTGGQDMLVDVTRMFNGVSADIAAITSWSDMAAVMPEYLSNVAYNEGEVVGRSGGVTTTSGNSATFNGLHGVGTAKDTQDVVTGEKTVKIGSHTFTGNENFYTYEDTFWCYIDGRKAGQKVIMAGFTAVRTPSEVVGHPTCMYPYPTNTQVYFGNQGCATIWAFKRWITGRTIYYELATPTSSTETPQPLTAVQGLNNVHEENMSITGTPLTMGYTGTDHTISADASSKYLARIDGVDSVLENVSSISVRGGRDRVVDLTYMFGVGNEPATAADFYKLFPTWLGYAIPYDKGSLVNFKGTGLKSVGFNLLDTGNRTLGEPQNTANAGTTIRGPFDETKYYLGFSASNYYNAAVVKDYAVTASSVYVKSSAAYYGIGFPIRVIPGQVYRIENFQSGKTQVGLYTYNGTHISTDIQQTITIPANCYWAMLCYVPTGSGTVEATFNNPCVHLQWSGGRNGDYEPYWDYTRPLPTLTYFPSGMNGRGGVYDETTSRQAVTRLAEVDMEDLEWTESNGSWTATVSGMKADTSAIVAENGLKPVVSGTSVTVQSETSPVGKLVYELANPSTVTFPEEANVTAQVSDYGTESVVPVNGYELVTAPFLGIVKYQDNYARTITKLPENYQSQESMDALQLVLGQLLNVTLTSRFNADEQAYGYTVTGDGVPGLIAAALTALAPVTGLTFRGGTYMPTDGMVALPDPTIQGITTIPASTSSYTLGEGVYSHAPNSVPTYTLPAVEDATVVHKARLTVKMSASVLTANFRDSSGGAISYEAPAGDVRSGTLVEYVCTYEPLAGGWAVSARVVMQTA